MCYNRFMTKQGITNEYMRSICIRSTVEQTFRLNGIELVYAMDREKEIYAKYILESFIFIAIIFYYYYNLFRTFML